jgi:hypothetical protein
MTDLIEDLLAFMFATNGPTLKSCGDFCPECGSRMAEGELCCDECADLEDD